MISGFMEQVHHYFDSSRWIKIILGSLIVAIIIGLFPPWTLTSRYKNDYQVWNAGYSFILSPSYTPDWLNADKVIKEEARDDMHSSINLKRLLIQWFVLALTTVVILVLDCVGFYNELLRRWKNFRNPEA